MDTQTRHALKNDKFAQATASSMSWVSGHRSGVVRWVIAAVVVAALALGVLVFWNLRSSAANSAFGAALDTYDAPLAQPGAPPEKGVYTAAADRSRAANKQFVAVAEQYGWLPEGTKAHYFVGITDRELGQNADAEKQLKIAAGSWDPNLSNLAKLALAGVYEQTARAPEAIDLYNEMARKPSETVSANVAELDLANLYASTGKQDQARALWAKVKDADKDGAAGSIAAQKLSGNK